MENLPSLYTDLTDNESIIMKKNTDIGGNIVTKRIKYEEHQIVKGIIVLDQIPSEYHRVLIKDYKEISNDSPLGVFDFKVNYNTGKIYFHSSQEGKIITILDYYGIGVELIPITRVYTNISKNGDIVETLGDIIKKANENLRKINNVNIDVEKIKKLQVELDSTTKTANNTQTILSNTLVSSRSIKNLLDSQLEKANKVNELINSGISTSKNSTSEINDKIKTAREVNNSLQESIQKAQEVLSKLLNSISFLEKHK